MTSPSRIIRQLQRVRYSNAIKLSCLESRTKAKHHSLYTTTKITIQSEPRESGPVVHAWNPSTRETDWGRSTIPSSRKTEISYTKTFSKTKTRKLNNSYTTILAIQLLPRNSTITQYSAWEVKTNSYYSCCKVFYHPIETKSHPLESWVNSQT